MKKQGFNSMQKKIFCSILLLSNGIYYSSESTQRTTTYLARLSPETPSDAELLKFLQPTDSYEGSTNMSLRRTPIRLNNGSIIAATTILNNQGRPTALIPLTKGIVKSQPVNLTDFFSPARRSSAGLTSHETSLCSPFTPTHNLKDDALNVPQNTPREEEEIDSTFFKSDFIKNFKKHWRITKKEEKEKHQEQVRIQKERKEAVLALLAIHPGYPIDPTQICPITGKLFRVGTYQDVEQ